MDYWAKMKVTPSSRTYWLETKEHEDVKLMHKTLIQHNS